MKLDTKCLYWLENRGFWALSSQRADRSRSFVQGTCLPLVWTSQTAWIPAHSPTESFRADFVILKSKTINAEHQNTPNEVVFANLPKTCFKNKLWALAWSKWYHRSALARRSGSLTPCWRDLTPDLDLVLLHFSAYFRILKLFSVSQNAWNSSSRVLKSGGRNVLVMNSRTSFLRRSLWCLWHTCWNSLF